MKMILRKSNQKPNSTYSEMISHMWSKKTWNQGFSMLTSRVNKRLKKMKVILSQRLDKKHLKKLNQINTWMTKLKSSKNLRKKIWSGWRIKLIRNKPKKWATNFSSSTIKSTLTIIKKSKTAAILRSMKARISIKPIRSSKGSSTSKKKLLKKAKAKNHVISMSWRKLINLKSIWSRMILSLRLLPSLTSTRTLNTIATRPKTYRWMRAKSLSTSNITPLGSINLSKLSNA